MGSHITMSLNENGSTTQIADSPDFEALEIDGWYGAALEDVGLFSFMFKIDADAPTYPIHSDPASWIGYVISGGGKLYCGDLQGEQTTDVEYSEGDFITFLPDTPHGWKNDDVESKILLIKRSS